MIDSIYKGQFGKEVQALPDILDLRASNLAGDLTTAEKDGIKTKLSIVDGGDGASLLTKTKTYTSGAQTITADFDIVQVSSLVAGNLFLQEGTQYTVSGAVVTIADTLTSGTVIQLKYWKANAVNATNYTKVESDALLSNKADISDLQDGVSFPYNQIQLPFKRTPIIPIDTDIYHVRELGNLMYSEVLNKYITVWTQGLSPYVQNEVYVYFAISDDIDDNWEVIGKITSTPSEDPYLVEENGTLYILTENKHGLGSFHDDIGLWKLTDQNDLLNGWTYLGYGLQKDPTKIWQSLDVSSPTYKRENGISYMFFEGRSSDPSFINGGAVGLATSTGIEEVFTHQPLIISGNSFQDRASDTSWGESNVPDDIVKIKDTYYLFGHTYQLNEGFIINIYQSKSLEAGWQEWLGNGVTFTNKGDNRGAGHFHEGKSFVVLDGGIFVGNWAVASKEIGKPIKNIDSETYTLKAIDKDYLLIFNNNVKCDLTIPKNLPYGLRYEGRQRGNGRVNLIKEVDVDINASLSFAKSTKEKFSNFWLHSMSSLSYDLWGDLAENLDFLILSTDITSNLNLKVGTNSGNFIIVDWGDGNVEEYSSASNINHSYSLPYKGDIKITAKLGVVDIIRLESNDNLSPWNFNIISLERAVNLTKIVFVGDKQRVEGDIFAFRNIEYLYLSGNLISIYGNISNLYNTNSVCILKGNKLALVGDISFVKNNSIQIILDGDLMELTYSASTFNTIPSDRIRLQLATSFLATSAEVDQLLIDLEAVGSTGTSVIDLVYNNAVATSNSSAARNALTNRGYDVRVNL